MNKSILEKIISYCDQKLEIKIESSDATLVALGATSMKLMQFVAFLYEEYNIIVELDELMGEISLTGLTELIAKRAGLSESLAEAGEEEEGLFEQPVSHLQMPFWELRHHSPAMVAYNDAVTFRIRGDLDLDICRQIQLDVVRSQVSLRTNFYEDNGVGMQREIPFEEIAPKLDIAYSDVSDEVDAMKICNEEFKTFFATKFDLRNPPLFKLHIWKIKENEWVVSCLVYHIIADLWSVNIVKDMAIDLYRAYSNFRQTDYPVYQPNYELGTSYTEVDRHFWAEQLTPAPTPLQLNNRPRSPIKRYDGQMYLAELKDVELEALEALRSRLNITMASLTMSAYYVLVAASTKQRDITLGTPYLARQHAANSKAVAAMVNTLPIRCHINEDLNCEEFAISIHKQLLACFEHGNYPVQSLIKELNIPHKLNRYPLYEQLFTYYEKPLEQFCSETGNRALEIELTRGKTKFDLTFFITNSGENLSCKAEYSSNQMKDFEVSRLVTTYQWVINQIMTQPEQKIGALLQATTERVSLSDTKVA